MEQHQGKGKEEHQEMAREQEGEAEEAMKIDFWMSEHVDAAGSIMRVDEIVLQVRQADDLK